MGDLRRYKEVRAALRPNQVTESSAPTLWSFPGSDWELGKFPKLMGIVNVTPDSFSDGGAFFDPLHAVDHALQLVEEGADLLDIGGESTRPGSTSIPLEEELRRVIPVIERVAQRVATPISIDTTKAEVARRALAAGAAIVNDISGLTREAAMLSVCAEAKSGVICMHMQGTPQTMQADPRYKDVLTEITAYLAERISQLEQSGVPRERVVIDPGIGFGKTAAHNLEIVRNISRFRALGRPVLIGHSRKRFLQKLIGRPLDERFAGTLAVSIATALQGVDVLRVHDVRATRDALRAFFQIAGDCRIATP
jgi:dihydropteroate synthase